MNTNISKGVWPPVLSGAKGSNRILCTRNFFGQWAWQCRPRFLRRREARRPVLFAGPWVGEFGWELMNWQGFLRAQRSHYETIIVSSRETSEPLYQDFCDVFLPHTIKGDSNAHVAFNIQNPKELDRILATVPPDADYLCPLRFVPAKAQHFIQFGNPLSEEDRVDVVLHARGRSSVVDRNWPPEKWGEVVRHITGQGLRVGCVGLRSATLDIEGLEDFRDLSFGRTVDVISSARLMVGPSSGAMHLAALCGTPHIIWTDQQTYGMGKTSREKYESWWNPLRTPVFVLDTHEFDPPVSVVNDVLDSALEHGLTHCIRA